MSEGRIYSVVFGGVTVSAAQDLFEITPASNKPIRIKSLHLSNVGGTADAGDAQEEILRLQVIRGFTASGSGGSAPTPGKVGSSAMPAAGFTAEVNNTTEATTGSTETLHEDGWNVRQPTPYVWVPESEIGASAANTTLVVRLTNAPADALSMSGTIYIEEQG